MQGVLSGAIARRLLRWHLVRMREAKNLSQTQAGDRIGRTQPAIAAMERGSNLPTQSNLEILCQYYGAAEDWPMMRDLLVTARKGNGESTAVATVEDFTMLVGLEPYAQKIEVYEQMVIAGLVQTEPYARVLLEHFARRNAGVDVEQALELRMHRQQSITRDEDPAELWFFVEEGALRRPVGTSDVMDAQLDHLLDLTDLPHINMQVLPLNIGPHSALAGSFQVVSLRDGLKVAYEETSRSAYYYDASDAVDAYNRIIDHLRHEALSPESSRTMVLQIKKELHS